MTIKRTPVAPRIRPTVALEDALCAGNSAAVVVVKTKKEGYKLHLLTPMTIT
jgi:hypothetical protein